MNTRRALVIALLAAALLPAVPAAAVAQEPAAIRDAVRTAARYSGGRDQRFEERDPQTHTVKVGASGSIEMRNIAGDITVTLGRGDTATIEIVKIARGASQAAAREQLGLVRVDVTERQGRVEVRAVYPDSRDRNRSRNVNVETRYRVTAPAGVRIKADSISGNISVSGIRGDLALSSISGNVTVRDAGRVITGRSISGNLELVSARNDAVVELSSTSGTVIARGLQLRRIDLASVSGNIVGRDLTCEQANLHTVSGDVEYTGTLTSGGRYEFRSHSGDVRLTLAGGTGFEIEASTFSGEVRSGLALRLEGAVSRRNRTVRATFGDGRAHITARSFSGDVLINGK